MGFTSWNPTRFLWLRAKKDPVSVLALKEKVTSGKYTRSILHDKGQDIPLGERTLAGPPVLRKGCSFS